MLLYKRNCIIALMLYNSRGFYKRKLPLIPTAPPLEKGELGGI
jgi:hypothetical protein